MRLTLKSLGPTLLLAATLPSICAETTVDAAKTYILATKEESHPAGTVIEESNTMTMKNGKLDLNLQGQIMEGSMTMTETEQIKWEFLAADKRRYTLVKGETKQEMIMMGQPAPMPQQDKALLNNSVIFTKKDGTWTGVLEKGNATKQEQAEIDAVTENFSQNTDFKIYGDTPRKVGDKWEVDGADAFDLGEMNDTDGKMTVKFEKIEKYQGTNCAVLKCSLNIKGDIAQMKGMNMGIKAEAIVHRSLADQVDLNNDLTGSMSMVGKMEPQPGFAIDMKMNGAMTAKMGAKVTRP